MALPPFAVLSASYPSYWIFPSPKTVQKLIGGEVQDPDITNTCTIRLSHALNAAGIAIPRTFREVTNRRGANKAYYIIRVSDFRAFMESRFGKPNVDLRKKAGARLDRSQIEGYQGVIAFEIGFRDATGHFDLWFQDRFSHEHSAGKDYFALASRISLWHDGSRTVTAPV